MIGEPEVSAVDAEALRRRELLSLLAEAEARLQAVAFTLGKIAEQIRKTNDPAVLPEKERRT